MVRLIFLFCCFAAFSPCAASSLSAPFRGQWRCVALDPRHLVLTGDYAEVQEQLFQKHYAGRRKSVRRRLAGWAADYCFNISGTEAIAEYRPRVTALLRDRPKIGISSASAPISVNRVGYWLNPIGQARFRD